MGAFLFRSPHLALQSLHLTTEAKADVRDMESCLRLQSISTNLCVHRINIIV